MYLCRGFSGHKKAAFAVSQTQPISRIYIFIEYSSIIQAF